MEQNDKPVKMLVVDSSVLIKRAPVKDLTDTAFAVPGVVGEIRDANTRASLHVLPYEFKFKEPNSDAIKFVANFSRKTGDYSNLSAVDLHLVALTYQLCKENLSADEFSRLRQEPIKNHASIINANELKLEKTVNIAGFYLPGAVKRDEKEADDSKTDAEKISSDLDKNLEIKNDENNNLGKEEEEVEEEEIKSDKVGSEGEEGEEDEDDDQEGWITPGNLEQVKQMSLHETEQIEMNDQKIQVACMTSDFSMQNVLIQIGIPVLSVEGLIIKKPRSYAFRCITCMKITTNMSKQFCPSCGYKSLERVVVTVDAEGNKIYRGRRKPITTKGLRHSLPTPKGGKHPNYPIIMEHQPMAQNLPSKKSLIKNNPLDPDYVYQSSPFAQKDVHSRASRLGIKPNRFSKR